MKKLLITLLLPLFSTLTTHAQTAPDFTATDCNGISHNLYSELNSGKVIVLVWVMPCNACIAASYSAYNIVQSYASPNVLYFLMDDDGGTSCTALSSWAASHNIGINRTTFSTSDIDENSYGGVGMPHITVVGTANHTVFFNGLNTAANNPAAIQNAINSALAAVGISENNSNHFQLSVLPSPAAQTLKVNYFLSIATPATLEIINEVGQSVLKNDLGKLTAGAHQSAIDLSNIANGVYLIRLTAGNNSQTTRFTVVH